ncbi:hypothetical protein [Streptomyces similanensis]|uniref:Uncharacterized protein n=1 Tax=Streptomyces similanensis TaxID=1274988 RepID=A0ABP9KSZ0_9ACTN
MTLAVAAHVCLTILRARKLEAGKAAAVLLDGVHGEDDARWPASVAMKREKRLQSYAAR